LVSEPSAWHVPLTVVTPITGKSSLFYEWFGKPIGELIYTGIINAIITSKKSNVAGSGNPSPPTVFSLSK
jgi:hypothetical protein